MYSTVSAAVIFNAFFLLYPAVAAVPLSASRTSTTENSATPQTPSTSFQISQRPGLAHGSDSSGGSLFLDQQSEAGAAIAAAATLGRGNLDMGFNLALTGPPGGLSGYYPPPYPYVEGVYAYGFPCGIYNCDKMIVETTNSWLGVRYDAESGRYAVKLVCEDRFQDNCNAVERYSLSRDNAFNVTSWDDWFNRFDRRFDCITDLGNTPAWSNTIRRRVSRLECEVYLPDYEG